MNDHDITTFEASQDAFFANAIKWRCECGGSCDPSAAEWRWTGEVWQHHHGYPMGHVDAEPPEEK